MWTETASLSTLDIYQWLFFKSIPVNQMAWQDRYAWSIWHSAKPGNAMDCLHRRLTNKAIIQIRIIPNRHYPNQGTNQPVLWLKLTNVPQSSIKNSQILRPDSREVSKFSSRNYITLIKKKNPLKQFQSCCVQMIALVQYELISLVSIRECPV